MTNEIKTKTFTSWVNKTMVLNLLGESHVVTRKEKIPPSNAIGQRRYFSGTEQIIGRLLGVWVSRFDARSLHAIDVTFAV